MQADQLWAGGPSFIQRPPVFKIGTDSVRLAQFVNLARVRKAVDLGCGSGILGVLLAKKSEHLTCDCIDILPEAVLLTQENAALNNVSAQISAKCGDILHIRQMLPAGAYDLAVANPPYFPQDSGKRAIGEEIANAREESLCSLEDVCRAASYLLRWGGRFALVHRPQRLAELMYTMHEHGIEPKRLQMVAKDAQSAPNLVLVEGQRGAKPGLVVLAPYLLEDES